MATKKTLEKLLLEMKDTLESLDCMEVVSTSSRNGDVRFLTRVTNEERWLTILSEFLARESGWYSFIGKKYFSRQGSLVFGWVLIFESENLSTTVTDVRALFRAIHDELSSKKATTSEGDAGGMIEISLPFNSGYEDSLQSRVKNVN